MLPTTNSQRGVPYEPSAAIRQREREAEKRSKTQAEIKRLRLRAEASSEVSPRKQHAQYLDQVEHAWQERARTRRDRW